MLEGLVGWPVRRLDGLVSLGGLLGLVWCCFVFDSVWLVLGGWLVAAWLMLLRGRVVAILEFKQALGFAPRVG